MRRVFFSFHYQNDYWRVQNVMNCQVVSRKYQSNKFLRAQEWEEVKRQGDTNIKCWIREQMHGASVLCVLIGSKTASRRWVKFEIQEAMNQGMGLIGVFIHGIRDAQGNTSPKGDNPFVKHFGFRPSDNPGYPCACYYDWVQNGRVNIGNWIEKAARQAGR